MTIKQIENNITELLKNFSKDDFIFEFLSCYGEPKANITLLKKNDLNQLKTKGKVTLRKKLFFKELTESLHGTIDTLRTDNSTLKHKPRFIIVTDYETLLAYDTKTADPLDIQLTDLVKHYDFFLPLAGMEKSTHLDENPADVRASNKLAKLYDEILKTNPTSTHEEVHALNVFLTRVLFCYFAEDSNIFDDNIFTDSITSHTQADGSDMNVYLKRLFEVFNTSDKNRESSLPQYLKVFPYVNGGLFRDPHPVPKFTTKSRNILIEIGKLNWSRINPDIFGSMIQAVVTPEHRGDMGMHYTSVPNIMKVIQPLFLDELYEAYEKAETSKKKLQNLIQRIANLKIFDPACGSGNFLIIAYKELRHLEIKIYESINKLNKTPQFLYPEIKLTQFYGIELDDFAHEVAILSLWLAEHQMNLEFYRVFGRTSPSLPLKDGGHIVHGNATRLDWKIVCPKVEGDEIYILGNPPYLGGKSQSKEQKEEMKYVFNNIKSFKELDYIACWFFLASSYIQENIKFAFVTTSSISEGAQVEQLWPLLLNENEIFFTYKSFNWTNNAKGKAGVTCTIIGLQTNQENKKYIYDNSLKEEVKQINAYLLNARNIIVYKKQKSISNLPPIITGNSPYEGGNLILSDNEKNELIKAYPQSKKYIKRIYGSNELINGIQRWCIWLSNEDLYEAKKIKPILNRIEMSKKFRINGGEVARGLSNRPHQFRYIHQAIKTQIIIPRVSSSRRKYIPIDFLNKDCIISDSAQAIYDSETWVFGLISSNIHNIWVKLTAGRLRNDIRYLSALCYNTFPFPHITKKQKEEITNLVFNILDEREQHSEKTLAQLYDPDKMPQDLKEAHHQLDIAIERCYRKRPFKNDEERLEYLFKLYEKMIRDEKK